MKRSCGHRAARSMRHITIATPRREQINRGNGESNFLESHQPTRQPEATVMAASDPSAIQLRNGSGADTGDLPRLHIALAVEDRAFLDDQLAGAEVAHQDGFVLEENSLAGGDVSSHLAADLCGCCLDLTFDRTLEMDGDRSCRTDGSFDGTFDG